MSRAEKNIIGLEHGKVGDRIGVVRGGKQYYKGLYKPTNPRSPKQQMHRDKLAFLNRLSAVLADAVNLGFAMVPKPGSGQTARNAFVHENWENGTAVWDDEHGEWDLCPERLLLAKGPRFISGDISAAVSEGQLHISCPTPGMSDSHSVADDRMYVAVYRPEASRLHLFAGPLREDCSECEFALPEEVLGKNEEMHVYVWFQATRYHRSGGGKITVRPNQASPSLYLGSI